MSPLSKDNPWVPDDEDLFTPKEAALILGIHYRTLVRWIQQGKVPTLGTQHQYTVRWGDLPKPRPHASKVTPPVKDMKIGPKYDKYYGGHVRWPENLWLVIEERFKAPIPVDVIEFKTHRAAFHRSDEEVYHAPL